MSDPKADKSPKYATAKHPTIEALVHGLYRYKDRAQALARFQSIAEHFVLSKEQPETTAENPACIFWIKGFGVTDDEVEKGFTGHFAQMEISTLSNGQFSLTAMKIDRPLTSHPQRKRPTSKHPNWGHPIMRAIKKGKIYTTIEAAQAELDQLHLEYPEVSIPGPAKLYIIIYEKREGIARPTHKIAIEIKTDDTGKFLLVARDNEKASKPASKRPPSAAVVEDSTGISDAKPGVFAAKVLLRKKTKRKNTGRPVTGLKPDVEA